MFEFKLNAVLVVLTIVTFQLTSSHPLTPDGPLSKLNAGKETGPIAKELFEAHPKLAFLGQINNKNIYIERIGATRWHANEGCTDLGMKLLKVDNQQELNFLTSTTTDDDNYSWIDGNIDVSSFRWADNTTLNTSLIVVDYDHWVGLVFGRYIQSPTIIRAYPQSERQYYICYV